MVKEAKVRAVVTDFFHHHQLQHRLPPAVTLLVRGSSSSTLEGHGERRQRRGKNGNSTNGLNNSGGSGKKKKRSSPMKFHQHPNQPPPPRGSPPVAQRQQYHRPFSEKEAVDEAAEHFENNSYHRDGERHQRGRRTRKTPTAADGEGSNRRRFGVRGGIDFDEYAENGEDYVHSFLPNRERMMETARERMINTARGEASVVLRQMERVFVDTLVNVRGSNMMQGRYASFDGNNRHQRRRNRGDYDAETEGIAFQFGLLLNTIVEVIRRFIYYSLFGIFVSISSTLVYMLLYQIITNVGTYRNDVHFDYNSCSRITSSRSFADASVSCSASSSGSPVVHGRIALHSVHNDWIAMKNTSSYPRRKKESFLQGNIEYYLNLELELSESELNKEIGVFMTNVTLINELEACDGLLEDDNKQNKGFLGGEEKSPTTSQSCAANNGSVTKEKIETNIASSLRPAMLKYSSPFITWLRHLVFFPFIIIDAQSESQLITIEAFDRFIESSEPHEKVSIVSVELSMPVEVIRAQVVIGPELSLLQWTLKTHFWSCASCGIGWIAAAQMMIAMQVLAMMEESEEKQRRAKNERERREYEHGERSWEYADENDDYDGYEDDNYDGAGGDHNGGGRRNGGGGGVWGDDIDDDNNDGPEEEGDGGAWGADEHPVNHPASAAEGSGWSDGGGGDSSSEDNDETNVGGSRGVRNRRGGREERSRARADSWGASANYRNHAAGDGANTFEPILRSNIPASVKRREERTKKGKGNGNNGDAAQHDDWGGGREGGREQGSRKRNGGGGRSSRRGRAQVSREEEERAHLDRVMSGQFDQFEVFTDIDDADNDSR
jgi:hypothetical protein